jgi:hypothetical protein
MSLKQEQMAGVATDQRDQGGWLATSEYMPLLEAAVLSGSYTTVWIY